MLNNDIKNDKGITLIALVLTVIVLLVLACISMFMLTSQDREKSVYSENEILKAKDHVIVTASSLFSEFYKEKYENNNESIKDITSEAYVVQELESKLDDKYASINENIITLKPTDPDGKIITGTYKSNGTIEWSYPKDSTTDVTNTNIDEN